MIWCPYLQSVWGVLNWIVKHFNVQNYRCPDYFLIPLWILWKSAAVVSWSLLFFKSTLNSLRKSAAGSSGWRIGISSQLGFSWSLFNTTIVYHLDIHHILFYFPSKQLSYARAEDLCQRYALPIVRSSQLVVPMLSQSCLKLKTESWLFKLYKVI